MTRNWETQAVFNWVTDLSADIEKEHVYADLLIGLPHANAEDLKCWVEECMIGHDI